ncbi:MAG: AAA family ATPase [Gammaproteobacteria bacterium]|nr:AAA family ATPase [Gammaproteobacteria bacterium]
MKLTYVEIENFKGLKYFKMDLRGYRNEPRSLTCLTGDNGSGKTTVLQAIALNLALATRKINSLPAFQWNGFIPERAVSASTRIKIGLRLDEDEIAATRQVYETWKTMFENPGYTSSSSSAGLKEISLVYEANEVTCVEGSDALFELRGRFYVKTLLDAKFPDIRTYFSRLGDVFWFDQYRNLGNSLPMPDKVVSWPEGIAAIREYLVGWWMYHTSEYKVERDFIEELQQRLKTVFPGLKLCGPVPMRSVSAPRPEDFFFYVQRNKTGPYDIAEMSSGEQAIFTMLYQLVYLEAMHSIILIDELELHLHPQQQQRLYGALHKLAPDSQFIITTHSPYLEDIIPEERIIRMPGEL